MSDKLVYIRGVEINLLETIKQRLPKDSTIEDLIKYLSKNVKPKSNTFRLVIIEKGFFDEEYVHGSSDKENGLMEKINNTRIFIAHKYLVHSLKSRSMKKLTPYSRDELTTFLKISDKKKDAFMEKVKNLGSNIVLYDNYEIFYDTCGKCYCY